jgi:hypothetical protein
MLLADMLARSRAAEEAAAALYRRWAAASRSDPRLCALWTDLARDEEGHARTIAVAQADLPAVRGWRTRIDGWRESLDAIEEHLRAAERLAPDASVAQQLAAALEIELTEMDALRFLVLDLAGAPEPPAHTDLHACRLADAATVLTTDAGVGLRAALLRVRAHMASAPFAPEGPT